MAEPTKKSFSESFGIPTATKISASMVAVKYDIPTLILGKDAKGNDVAANFMRLGKLLIKENSQNLELKGYLDLDGAFNISKEKEVMDVRALMGENKTPYCGRKAFIGLLKLNQGKIGYQKLCESKFNKDKPGNFMSFGMVIPFRYEETYSQPLKDNIKAIKDAVTKENVPAKKAQLKAAMEDDIAQTEAAYFDEIRKAGEYPFTVECSIFYEGCGVALDQHKPEELKDGNCIMPDHLKNPKNIKAKVDRICAMFEGAKNEKDQDISYTPQTDCVIVFITSSFKGKPYTKTDGSVDPGYKVTLDDIWCFRADKQK